MSGKTLHRSRDDRMLGGVCAGIAAYLDLDPTIVRLLAVLLVVIGNVAAVIAYIVMWIAVPEELVPGAVLRNGGDAVTSKDSAHTPVTGPGPESPAPPPPYAGGGSASPQASYQAHRPLPDERRARRGTGGAWVGAVLVFVGAALLVQMFVPSVRLWDYWPVVIIAAGVLMIVRSKGGDAR